MNIIARVGTEFPRSILRDPSIRRPSLSLRSHGLLKYFAGLEIGPALVGRVEVGLRHEPSWFLGRETERCGLLTLQIREFVRLETCEGQHPEHEQCRDAEAEDEPRGVLAN